MKSKKNIAYYVNQARRKNFMTQTQFAEFFDTDQGNVSKMENGLRNIPREKIEWLAEECGVSVKTIREAWQLFQDAYGAEVL